MSILTRLNPFAKNELDKKELVLNNPSGWDFLTGGATWSGVSVNDTTALQMTASWQAIRLISETLGTLPLHLYKKTDNGREKVTDHRLSKLIKRKPNKYMTAVEWKEGIGVDLLCNGHSYAKKLVLGDQIFSITPIPKNCCVPRILEAPSQDIAGSQVGDLVYKVTENGKQKDYPQEEILSIKGFGGVGHLEGYAPHKMHRQSLGVTLAAEEFSGRFFGNGAHMGGFIEFDQILDPKQRDEWAKNFAERHSTAETAHKWALLEKGMKAVPRAASNNDNQLLETRKHQIAEVARIYNMPLSMLMEMDRATWGNTEQHSLHLVKHTVSPYTVRIESAFDNSLLTEKELDQGYYFEYDLNGLLRGDLSSRSQFYKDMRMAGAMTQNEIRVKENLPRLDGGDDLHVPMNMAPSDILRDVLLDDETTSGGE